MTALCSKGIEMRSWTSSDGFTRQVSVSLHSCSVWSVAERYDSSSDVWLTCPQVSSVTQTTATEKEVLSQLLQEKDQLQREQEDRIKNLTKLLVTSSNLVPVKKVRVTQTGAHVSSHHYISPHCPHFVFYKMPKRRVTWGGKMLRLVRPSACGGGPSDLSFAEPFSRKRKADRSSLLDLGEGRHK